MPSPTATDSEEYCPPGTPQLREKRKLRSKPPVEKQQKYQLWTAEKGKKKKKALTKTRQKVALQTRRPTKTT